MKLISVAGAAGARPTKGFIPYGNDAAEKESSLKKYESLLHKIATGFGFDENETYDLIQQVWAYARTHPAADCYPIHIWLSKIMVHSCTFRIGSRLFGQPGGSTEKGRAGSVDGFSAYGTPRERDLQDMPLSFRACYILSHCVGFGNQETALILNTTPANVLERCNKALAFLGPRR